MADGHEGHHHQRQQEGDDLTDLEVPECLIEGDANQKQTDRQDDSPDVEIIVELRQKVADECGQSTRFLEIGGEIVT